MCIRDRHQGAQADAAHIIHCTKVEHQCLPLSVAINQVHRQGLLEIRGTGMIDTPLNGQHAHRADIATSQLHRKPQVKYLSLIHI